jgi:oxalate---CoA ligase
MQERPIGARHEEAGPAVGLDPNALTLPFVGEIRGDDLDRAAVLAPGREPMTYRRLVEQVSATATTLTDLGVARDHRVALLVPNGPEAVTAFLGIAAAAICAPLNPAYQEHELRFFLDDLQPSVLIVADGVASTAARLASASGLRTLLMRTDASLPAGAFTLEPLDPDDPHGAWSVGPAPTALAPPSPDETALVLHTSGTTSRPKLVPLSHGNLSASARNVGRTLQLQPDDRCLNVMPMFHIHGIVAALLGTLDRRGSIIAAPAFDPVAVVDWVGQLTPTWYTAVPTIHASMLRVAEQNDAVRTAFRFIRSSSAALPTSLLERMEHTFDVPVIEAYGMTEAAHQMASNAPPPAQRKPGTVGMAAGPDVAVMDEHGTLLDAGVVGEIVIRGDNVTSGYVNNPTANASAFRHGWFRTGDRGVLDPDGYLTITGRIKEIINRGGEKVAPTEVEDALLAHEDVAEAVVFAAPHASLGEDVAAAIVLRPGALVSKGELREFVGVRLAAFKVPRQLVFVDHIPKGATGKLQRIGLAERLGLGVWGRTAEPFVPPRTDTERAVAELFERVLDLDRSVGATDDFLDLGADSLHVKELLSAIEDRFARRIPATGLIEGARVESIAAMLDEGGWRERIRLIEVQRGGATTPIFCMMRAASLVLTRNFAAALGPDRPIVGLWMPAMHGPSSELRSIEDGAAECVDAIRRVQPHGPYVLFGYSSGGIVAYEMSRQLIAAGERVALLALADSPLPKPMPTLRSGIRVVFSKRGPSSVAWQVRDRWSRRHAVPVIPPPDALARWVTDTDDVADLDAAYRRERRWKARPISALVVMFNTRESIDKAGSPYLGWEKVGVDGWTAFEVPGSHETMLGEPHVRELTAKLAEALRDL